MYLLSTLPESLQDKIMPEPMSGCWIWIGSRNDKGYGSKGVGLSRTAHREVYLRTKGDIPPGFDVDHLCRLRCCVNPNHLEAVSHQENIRRGIKFFCDNGVPRPNQNSVKKFCKRGHEFTSDNTKITSHGGRQCTLCFNAYRKTVRRARRAAGVPMAGYR